MLFVLLYFSIGLLIPLALNNHLTSYIDRRGYYNVRWTPFLVYVSLLWILVRGLAYNTGVDYLYYYSHYLNVHSNVYNSWGEHTEFGYKLLIKFLTLISAKPELFFTISSCFYLVSSIKLSSIFGRSVFYIMLIWPLFMFILSMNLYRQYIALSAIYLLVYYLFNKRYLLSAFFCLVAISFHFSSIISIASILIIYLFKNVYTRWYYISLILILIYLTSGIVNRYLFLTFDVIQLYLSDFKAYSYSVEELERKLYQTTLLQYVVMTINVIWIWLGEKVSKQSGFFRLIYFMSVISFLLYPLSQQEILSRIHLYFMSFVPFMLGYLLFYYRRKSMFRFYLLTCTMLFYLVRYLYYLYKLGFDFPYQIRVFL
jgi:hypothetical protein